MGGSSPPANVATTGEVAANRRARTAPRRRRSRPSAPRPAPRVLVKRPRRIRRRPRRRSRDRPRRWRRAGSRRSWSSPTARPVPRLAPPAPRGRTAPCSSVHAEGAARDRRWPRSTYSRREWGECLRSTHRFADPARRISWRMDQALEAAAEAPEGGRPSRRSDELNGHDATRGLVQLGVNVDATSKLDRTTATDRWPRRCASSPSPAGLRPPRAAGLLKRAGLMAAAEVVARAVASNSPPLRTLMQALWAELERRAMPLWKVRRAGTTARPEECLFEDGGHTIVLVASLAADDLAARPGPRPGPPGGPRDSPHRGHDDSLAAGAPPHRGGYSLFRVVLGARPLDFIVELNAKVREFEATLARAPQGPGRAAPAVLERRHDRCPALPGRAQGSTAVVSACAQLLRDRPEAPDRGPPWRRGPADARGPAAAHQQRRRGARHELRRGTARHHAAEPARAWCAPRMRPPSAGSHAEKPMTTGSNHDGPGSALLEQLVRMARRAARERVAAFDAFMARNGARAAHSTSSARGHDAVGDIPTPTNGSARRCPGAVENPQWQPRLLALELLLTAAAIAPRTGPWKWAKWCSTPGRPQSRVRPRRRD